MKSTVLTLGLLSIAAPLTQASDALGFFNNWFVTGDYVAAGVGLKNTNGAGAINFSGVPCTVGTGLLSAIVPCSVPGSTPAYPVAAFLYWQNVESVPAYANKGTFNGFTLTGVKMLKDDSTSKCWVTAPTQALRSYRADVLRFLPIDPKTKLRLANGKHTLALGTAGGNSGVLSTMGASLVVIYKIVVPGNPFLAPYRSVVIYDGEFTMTKGGPDMTQTVAGFYQAADDEPYAKMTAIVGNGQTAYRETLSVAGENEGPDDVGPFYGAQGANWDSPTYPFDLNSDASSFNVRSHVTSSQSCLSWSAIVASTNVQDSDGDGLLDVWETRGVHRNTQASPATFGGCSDYPSEPCVNLPAMGAKNGLRDIFLQVDWLHGDGSKSTTRPAHSHMPKVDALKQVAAAFAARGVFLHFDLGNSSYYQSLKLPFIVPAAYSSGGSDIDEDSLACQGQNCAYPGYPALSFKLGFNSVRDGNYRLNIAPHFAQNRKDVFRYVLFAHALAGPFDANNKPLPDPFTGAYGPRSFSGIADRPGGDVMVSLGLWRSDIPANDQVGSVIVQAGTLMHEIGHTLGLSHAGWTSQPNCAPNYQSVMSYLYQTRGLTDANGVPQIDYSNGLVLPLNESALSATSWLGLSKYRFRYYAPLAVSDSAGQAAKRHCNGSAISGVNGDVPLIRKEAASLATPDWSNGTVTPLGKTFPLDVNFDGIPGELLVDSPDWFSIDLRQIGARSNFGSVSVGSVATDAGSSVATDAGSVATDAGSVATDAGSVATDAGSVATDAGDEDYDSHVLTTTDTIPTPAQCSGCGLFAVNEIGDIKLNWTPPDTGVNLVYNIYRCAGTGCNPLVATAIFKKIYSPTSIPQSSNAAPVFLDVVNDFVNAGATCLPANTCYNTFYTYAVTAVSQGGLGTESPYSNTASSKVTHLFVVADTKSIVYGTANPAPTYTVQGEVAGALTTGVTCSYTPSVPRNAGVYQINCTGPASVSSTDGVDYQLPYLTFVPGTLTITQRPLTVTAQTDSKTYDGTTKSTAVPVQTGTLAWSDTVTWTESYDSRNVGNRTMIPSGTVNDQNNGNNYKVSFVNAAGSISQAPLTITAQTNTKVYDSTTSAAAAPVATGVQPGDSVTLLAETYDTPNAGTGKTLSVTPGYSVNDGNGGANYKVSLVANTTGVIQKANPTVTVTGYSVTYDRNPHTASGTAKGVLSEALAGLDLSGTTHTNAGPYTNTSAGSYIDSWTFTDSTGNYNNATGTVTDTIAKASPTVTVTGYSVPYDAQPHTVTNATVTGVGGEVPNGVFGLAGTTHTNAGNYTDNWTWNDSTGNYLNSGGNVLDQITPVDAKVVVTPYTNVPYDGTAHTASATATGVNNANLLSLVTLPPAHVNAGTYSGEPWTFHDGAGNYKDQSGTVTNTITPVDPVITVVAYNVTYDTLPHAPNVTATGVGGVNLNGYLNLTTRISAGSYLDPWLFKDPNGNYNPKSGAVTDVINQATASITVTPYSVTYDGSPHTAKVSATGINNVDLSAGVDLTGTTHTLAGDYPTDKWKFHDLNGNYADAAGTVHDVIASGPIDLTSLTLPTGGTNPSKNSAAITTTIDGQVLRFTTGQSQGAAAWWTQQKVDAGFSTTFQFRISPSGNTPLADGFAFVIQNASTGSGTLQISDLGGNIGYAGMTNSIAIEFDTYYNSENGDPNSPHIGIQSNGTIGNSPNHATAAAVAAPVVYNFADGGLHTATIKYSGGVLSVYMDGNPTPTITQTVNLTTLFPLTGGTAFVGFTSATGWGQENFDLVNWTWLSTFPSQ